MLVLHAVGMLLLPILMTSSPSSSSSSLVQIRPLEPTKDDQDFVWRMLQHAAHETETDIDEVKANSLLRPYAENFGRTGDLGVVAFIKKSSPNSNDDEDGSSPSSSEATGSEFIPIGAAWVRSLGCNGFAASELRNQMRDAQDDDSIDKDALAAEIEELESLPELAIACLPEHRGMGVGYTLLDALIQSAHRQSDNSNDKYPRGICLSCRQDNQSAMKLYERIGFVKVPKTEQTNRVGGTSVTMKYTF